MNINNKNNFQVEYLRLQVKVLKNILKLYVFFSGYSIFFWLSHFQRNTIDAGILQRLFQNIRFCYNIGCAVLKYMNRYFNTCTIYFIFIPCLAF